MKPRQLATLLGIAPATLRNWAGKTYREFLSPKGQGVNGAYRSFDEVDARILAWVALMKAQNTSAEEIYLTLKTAKTNNWRDLPPLPGGIVNDEPIAVVPREAVEERLSALQERYELQLQAIVKERDQLQQQLEAAQEEIKVARQEASTLRQETIGIQRETSSTVQALQQRINELGMREAELRGALQQYTFSGRRWNVGALIAITLLAGVVLTVLVLVIGTLLAAR